MTLHVLSDYNEQPFNILTAAGNANDLLNWFLSVYGVVIGP